MKKLFLIGLVALACLGVARCNEWEREQDARALESCAAVHSRAQCEAWAGRGY